MDDKQVTVLRYIAFLAGFLHYPGFKFNAVCSNTGCIYTDPSMYKVWMPPIISMEIQIFAFLINVA